MVTFTQLLGLRLEDEGSERIRRNHEQCLRELQQAPAAVMAVVANVALVDGVETNVAHGLGRAPVWIKESVVRGPASTGRIEEIRGTTDRTKAVVLKATGWGATITIDLAVM